MTKLSVGAFRTSTNIKPWTIWTRMVTANIVGLDSNRVKIMPIFRMEVNKIQWVHSINKTPEELSIKYMCSLSKIGVSLTLCLVPTYNRTSQVNIKGMTSTWGQEVRELSKTHKHNNRKGQLETLRQAHSFTLKVEIPVTMALVNSTISKTTLDYRTTTSADHPARPDLILGLGQDPTPDHVSAPLAVSSTINEISSTCKARSAWASTPLREGHNPASVSECQQVLKAISRESKSELASSERGAIATSGMSERHRQGLRWSNYNSNSVKMQWEESRWWIKL